MTKEDLIAFETDVAERFNRGEIPYPVHLSHGNEDALIEVFQDVRPDDWVFSTWRNHYHALLHGIPPEKVMSAILAGRSIALCFPEHRFFSSAIVGGCLPIAVGVAMGVKRQPKSYSIHFTAPDGDRITHIKEVRKSKVWVFVGDMASMTGAFHEATEYAWRHDLPLNVVVEDNGLSVCTPTREAWGEYQQTPFYKRYSYTNEKYPHSGAGRRVEF